MQTLLIDKHGNKSFTRQRKVDVINLLLSFNFYLFTHAHLIERHNINNYNEISKRMKSSTSREEEPPRLRAVYGPGETTLSMTN